MDLSFLNRAASFPRKELEHQGMYRIMSDVVQGTSNSYTYEDGTPKKTYSITISDGKKEGSLFLNASSLKSIGSMYGFSDTSEWVGKWLRCSKEYDRAKGQENVYFDPVEDSENKKLEQNWSKTKTETKAEKPLSVDDVTWEE